MKKCTWDNPNKMHFDSAYKTFNRQTNVISTGNVIANTQLSGFIRPWNETECYGATRAPGHLCKYDLQYFRNIPANIERVLYDKNRTDSVILYQFRVWKEKERAYEIIGYVLTDRNYKLIDSAVCCEYGCSFWKRASAIEECKKYICA